MFIDFHTHVFPDKLAPHAIESLKKMAENGTGKKDAMTAYVDGTLSALKGSMEHAGIDASVVLPVCTRPEQFDSVNRFASEINGKDGIYAFGGIHPDCDHIDEKLENIKEMGLYGVKLHPAYQGHAIDSKKNVKIVKKCLKLGLHVIFHCGYDVAFPGTGTDDAERFEKAYSSILNKYGSDDGAQIILAHAGGLTTVEQTLDHLCGMPIYLDLALALEAVKTDNLMRLIRTHGADRILFGTDSPWSSQRKSKERLASLPISKAEYEMISCENAKKILKF